MRCVDENSLIRTILSLWILSQLAVVHMIQFFVLPLPDGRDGWSPERRVSKDSGTRRRETVHTMFYSWYYLQREILFQTSSHTGDLIILKDN